MSTNTPTEAAPAIQPAVEVAPTPVVKEAAPAIVPAAVELTQGQPKIAEAASQPPVTPAVEAPKPGTEFVAAFGDIGARWFLEGKQFSACAADFVADLRKQHTDTVTALSANHKTAIDAKDAEIADLKTKLAAAPRGNDAAGFQAESKKDGTKPDQKLVQNLGENIAKFAAGIKFAETPTTTLPVK